MHSSPLTLTLNCCLECKEQNVLKDVYFQSSSEQLIAVTLPRGQGSRALISGNWRGLLWAESLKKVSFIKLMFYPASPKPCSYSMIDFVEHGAQLIAP